MKCKLIATLKGHSWLINWPFSIFVTSTACDTFETILSVKNGFYSPFSQTPPTLLTSLAPFQKKLFTTSEVKIRNLIFHENVLAKKKCFFFNVEEYG